MIPALYFTIAIFIFRICYAFCISALNGIRALKVRVCDSFKIRKRIVN